MYGPRASPLPRNPNHAGHGRDPGPCSTCGSSSPAFAGSHGWQAVEECEAGALRSLGEGGLLRRVPPKYLWAPRLLSRGAPLVSVLVSGCLHGQLTPVPSVVIPMPRMGLREDMPRLMYERATLRHPARTRGTGSIIDERREQMPYHGSGSFRDGKVDDPYRALRNPHPSQKTG